MHGLMDTWHWFWMGFMIVTWVVLIAVVVYAAVWFAMQPHHRHGHLYRHGHPS